jgi:biotin operon repressor
MFYFIELCQKERTGSRQHIAKSLNMSESAVKRMINDLRDAGMDIKFNYEKRSYVLESNSQFRNVHSSMLTADV